MNEVNANTIYRVVMNVEEQYSIWDKCKELPYGWVNVGAEGSRDQCLEWIEKNWTDMRPLSIRSSLEKG